MKYTFFLRMSDLHVIPITNIAHNACRYTVELGVSVKDLKRITFGNNHTAYMHICRRSAVCIKNYPQELMQPSSSTRATIVIAENQIGATIVKAIFSFAIITWFGDHEDNLEMKV